MSISMILMLVVAGMINIISIIREFQHIVRSNIKTVWMPILYLLIDIGGILGLRVLFGMGNSMMMVSMSLLSAFISINLMLQAVDKYNIFRAVGIFKH